MSTIKVSFNGVFYAQEDETTIFETVFYRWVRDTQSSKNVKYFECFYYHEKFSWRAVGDFTATCLVADYPSQQSLRNILGGDSTDTEIDIDVEYNEPSEDDEDDEDDEEDSDDDESEDDDD